MISKQNIIGAVAASLNDFEKEALCGYIEPGIEVVSGSDKYSGISVYSKPLRLRILAEKRLKGSKRLEVLSSGWSLVVLEVLKKYYKSSPRVTRMSQEERNELLKGFE